MKKSNKKGKGKSVSEKKSKKSSRKHWFWGCFFLFFIAVVYSFFTVSFFTPGEHLVEKVLRKVPFDTRYLILVDFSKASGQERLYIYDVKKTDFIYSGIVQHGLGRGSTARHPEFSNELGSKCSSLGLYKVAELSKIHRIKTADIPCFRLDGLSKTNSNARRRGLLIHYSLTASLIPFEIWGVPLPLTQESEGCFAVSAHTMLEIARLNLEGKVYLYAFDGDDGHGSGAHWL